MKKLIILIIAIIPICLHSQRVGVNTTTPSGTMEVVGTEPNVTALTVENDSGTVVDVNVSSATNSGIGLRIDNAGLGKSLQILSTESTSVAHLAFLQNYGEGRTIEILNENSLNDEIVFYLNNKGEDHAMQLVNSKVDNTKAVFEAYNYGLGRVMDLNNTNVNNTQTTLYVRNNSTTTNVSIGYALRVQSDAARASYFVNKSGGLNSCGIYSRNESPDGINIACAGLIASDGGQAGNTAIYAYGDIAASSKSFIIDHPIDPANKYLKHFSIESDEALLIYRGQAILDENGKAVIELKDYQTAIIKNITYNLTSIGSPTVFYVEEEVSEAGLFVIAGDKPGAKVNWTIYAERDDAYFKTYPTKKVIEIEKPEDAKGLYIHPVAHGKTLNEGLDKSDNQSRETQEK